MWMTIFDVALNHNVSHNSLPADVCLMYRMENFDSWLPSGCLSLARSIDPLTGFSGGIKGYTWSASLRLSRLRLALWLPTSSWLFSLSAAIHALWNLAVFIICKTSNLWDNDSNPSFFFFFTAHLLPHRAPQNKIKIALRAAQDVISQQSNQIFKPGNLGQLIHSAPILPSIGGCHCAPHSCEKGSRGLMPDQNSGFSTAGNEAGNVLQSPLEQWEQLDKCCHSLNNTTWLLWSLCEQRTYSYFNT